jgi:hypothetical protein
VPLKLLRQRLQEDPALERVDRRCGGLDGCVFVITEAERHWRGSGRARDDFKRGCRAAALFQVDVIK